MVTGIHGVFPPDKDDDEDTIYHKKIIKKEGAWSVIKNVLGFDFDDNPGDHTIWLTEDFRADILEKLKKWIREGDHRKIGISFEEFWTYIAKLINDFIYIPYGKELLSPCNQLLGRDPTNIFLRRNKPLLSAIGDCRHLLKL